jgi:Domain of unknown function (DUF4112)
MKAHIRFAERLMTLMDTKFSIFGIKFGLDPFLDIWPGFGSLIGAIVSCYLFWIAYQLKVPSKIYWRMGWHIFLDFIVGELPVIGFFFDLFYKANQKNLRLLYPFIDPEILEGVVVEE